MSPNLSVKGGGGTPLVDKIAKQYLKASLIHSKTIPMMDKVSNISVCMYFCVYVRDNLEKLCRPFLRFWYKEMSVCSPDFATNQPASPAHNIVIRDTTWNFKNMQKKI